MKFAENLCNIEYQVAIENESVSRTAYAIIQS